jgi:anti-anti-sigma regulatory factor
MDSMLKNSFIVDSAAPARHIVRFAQPDVRDRLESSADAGKCELFRQLRDAALDRLKAGELLVLNLALLEVFTTDLYRFLLKVRETVHSRQASLALCRLNPEHRELFELFKGTRLFHIADTERQAVRAWEG